MSWAGSMISEETVAACFVTAWGPVVDAVNAAAVGAAVAVAVVAAAAVVPGVAEDDAGVEAGAAQADMAMIEALAIESAGHDAEKMQDVVLAEAAGIEDETARLETGLVAQWHFQPPASCPQSVPNQTASHPWHPLH